MSNPPRSHLRLETVDSVTVVHFVDPKIVADEIIQDVHKELLDVVEQAGGRQLLLNFRDVQFMSSSALANLLHLDKKLKERQGTLKLCGLKPVQVELFRVTGLDHVFEIHADEATALDSF